MTDPPSTPPKSFVARSVRRIVAEALVLAFVGALVLGIFWELQLFAVGLIVACVIWISGAPLLELLRLRQTRK